MKRERNRSQAADAIVRYPTKIIGRARMVGEGESALVRCLAASGAHIGVIAMAAAVARDAGLLLRIDDK